MSKKKTRRGVASAALPEYPGSPYRRSIAAMLGCDLKNLYFGPSIDVPERVCLDAEQQAKALKLRKKPANEFVAAVCAAYRAGFKKGEDEAAARAEQRRFGEQRANEDKLRHVNRAVARAIEALVPILKNNEVAGSPNSLVV